MSVNERGEELLAADAERRVSMCTLVGELRSGGGTVVTFAVGGILSVEGDLGLGGNSVTAVTGVGGLGVGVRPLGTGLDLDLELLLRARAMMRIAA